MGAPVFWKGKYFITQRNGIHRTSKSKYCTGSKMMTLLPLRLLPRYKRVNPPPGKAADIAAAHGVDGVDGACRTETEIREYVGV